MVLAMPEPAPDLTAAQSAVIDALITAFARREIDGHDDLHNRDSMPPELWRAIGAASLARIALPKVFGGTGGGFRVLAAAAETMSAEGGVMGVVTSWLARQLQSRMLFLDHGDAAQRATYLPDLAAGRLTPALAISEPRAGAHPKYLAAAAIRDGDDYVLNGEKAYVTNGPIADLFLVLAITGTEESRKRFSILIVPRDTPGLTLTDGVKIDFLHPAPHCGLRLQNVRVPRSGLLGPEGDAFDAMSLPMRRVEDALALATLAGALRHQIARLARELAGHALNDNSLSELGMLAMAPDGLSALAGRATALLDDDLDNHADHVAGIAGAGREWGRMLVQRMAALMKTEGFAPSPGLAAECRDIEKSLGIARAVHIIQAQRRARALLRP